MKRDWQGLTKVDVPKKKLCTLLELKKEKYFNYEIHIDAECRETNHIKQTIKTLSKKYVYHGESFPFSRTMLCAAKLKEKDAEYIKNMDYEITIKKKDKR